MKINTNTDKVQATSYKLQAKKGFTLIEVIIGIFVLAVVNVTLYSVINLVLKVQWETKAKAGANVIANQYAEIVHNLPYDSIGIVGGIPSGVIEATDTKTLNNIDYTINTSIIYMDDPFDGLTPVDLLSADYKSVRVEVSWPYKLNTTPITYVTNISPRGIESEAGGGTLRITVLNASGQPVPQANVHIENTDIVPNVNMDILTNDSGMVLLPGADPSIETYDITITKSGYSTDKTYEVDPINLPTPSRPPLSVIEGELTDASFAIDLVSTMTVFAFTTNTYTPIWWDENYGFRKRLTVQNDSSQTIQAGYSVKFDFDHYSEVASGDSLATGDDVRLLWWNGSSWIELDRVNETPWNDSSTLTEIWFQTQSQITASSFDDNYFIYYGNTAPASPLNNAHNVYTYWDDFSDEGLTYANWTTSTYDWVVESGEYHQTSSSGEKIAWTGSIQTNHLIQADLRTISGSNDVGLISRFANDDNYYIARPSDLPIEISEADNQATILGKRTLVESSDNTLGFFAASTTDDVYKLYRSTDNGTTWVESWQSANTDEQLGHAAWIDNSSDDLYFTYAHKNTVSGNYDIKITKFSYNGTSNDWTEVSTNTVTSHAQSERPYNPQIIKNNGKIFITYARYQTDNKNEIAVRISTDEGSSWSSEEWLTSWAIQFVNADERDALRGELTTYNGDVVSVINGAQSIGWSTYNGSAWSTYSNILTNTFQNKGMTILTTGTSPSQNLHIIYRLASDNGRPHHHIYNGTSWIDETINQLTTGYTYESTFVDNKIVFFFTYPNDQTGSLMSTGWVASEWLSPDRIYFENTPTNEIISLADHTRDGYIFTILTANKPSNANAIFAHHIGLVDISAEPIPVISAKVASALVSATPMRSIISSGQTYEIQAILQDDLVSVWTDNVLIFADEDNTFSQGKFGLYANNTESYFDNYIVRQYTSPEPIVTGNLEETYAFSQPLNGVTFTLQGNKIIGLDTGDNPVYKYSTSHTTDANGKVVINDLEWDSYTISVDDTVEGYDISGIDPPDPISLLPDTDQQVNIYFTSDETYSLRVIVLDVNDLPIENAIVQVQNAGLSYNETETTPSWGQTFYSPLSNAIYNVDITKTGYDPFSGTANVDNDIVLRVTLIEEGGSPPPPSAPDAPTITGITNIAETSMTLNWLDNADNEDGYKIYRSLDTNKPGTPLTTIAANSTVYPASSLTCNTPYYWWVEAYNTQGSADDTDNATTLTCPTPPNAPMITSFTNVEETSMTINWTDNANNEDGYRIYRNTINTKPGSEIATLSANSTSYPATGLDCGTDPYYWWVEAYNAQGMSDDTSSQATSNCAPTIVFSDLFTESSNTVLSSHIPDVGTSWTRLIEVTNNVENGGNSRIGVHRKSNQLRDNGWCYRSDGVLYQTDIIPSTDYEVQVIQINGDTNDDFNHLAARIQDSQNLYSLEWNESSSRLFIRSGGTWTQISGPGPGVADGSTVILKVEGNTISAIDDSIVILSVTNSTISSAGRAGIGMGAIREWSYDDCNKQKLDYFQVLTTN